MEITKNKIIFAPMVIFLLFLGGCKSDNVSPESDHNLSVGYFVENSSNDNTMVIDEAKFVVRKMVLENEDGDHGGECDVKIGPFVVYLDFSQKVVVAALAQVPAGSFHEIKFQIHKPSPNESVSDPEFVESTSQRFSVIVKGFFNGVRFVYKSPITVEREIEFEHVPIIVTTTDIINITIRLDVFSWFAENGTLLDPTDPSNSNKIDQNIKDSFKRAFRDLNMDGDPD